jgi:hypothetical protein
MSVVRRLAILLLLASLASPAGQAPSQELPPLSWICPMHADVVEGDKGRCPVCGMDLAPMRLDLAWSCPIHQTGAETQPGVCRLCGRDLVRVTVSLAWTCPMHPGVKQLEPGRCPEGAHDLMPTREIRPHGDHNPRHGGLFFMAPDNWHHLEGTYPEPGVFRVFVYDDYTRAIGVGAFSGRAVTRETFDTATRKSIEHEAFALRPSDDGSYLEARFDPVTLPARITAKVRLDADGPEHRFDFVFPEHSREPAAGETAPPAAGPLRSLVIPGTADEIVTELGSRREQVRELIEQGALNQINVPALEAKELALALEPHGSLAAGRRDRAVRAVRRLVLSAWRLDAYGDVGDRPKVDLAYEAFAAALADLTEAYGAPNR